MQWRHRSVRIALLDINKKGVKIDGRQNRCHNDTEHASGSHVFYFRPSKVNSFKFKFKLYLFYNDYETSYTTYILVVNSY